MYTIKREIGRLDGIKLGLVGDLANGRTVRSLAYLIAMYPDIKIYFVSPEVVKMKVQLFNIMSLCFHYTLLLSNLPVCLMSVLERDQNLGFIEILLA